MSAAGGGRLLFVHAHPDDETIETGATMAAYAARGAQVTLVTCTLGEMGEVIPPELAHLAAGVAGDGGDGLGRHRIGELAAACAALGVRDHRFLGGPGRWRDSGMMGTPANDDPRCFWRAELAEAARELLAVITEVRPDVLVSYDERGFYGHPDHIQAHRVSRLAFELAAGRVRKLYATALPRSALAEAMALTGEGGGAGFSRVASLDEVPFGTDDANVTAQVDAGGFLDAKIAAMRAHGTQIAVDAPFYALSDMVGRRAAGTEHYTLLAGRPGPAGPGGRESDLLAGLG